MSVSLLIIRGVKVPTQDAVGVTAQPSRLWLAPKPNRDIEGRSRRGHHRLDGILRTPQRCSHSGLGNPGSASWDAAVQAFCDILISPDHRRVFPENTVAHAEGPPSLTS